MKQLLLIGIVVLVYSFSCNAQLKADAGRDTVWCSPFPNSVSGQLLGGANVAQGGVPPYTYQWRFYDSLGNMLHILVDTPSLARPRFALSNLSRSLHLTYAVLSVTDATAAMATDTTKVCFSWWLCNMQDCEIRKHPMDTANLLRACSSNFSPFRFNWTPGVYLSDSTAELPQCWSPVPQLYTMVMTDATGCVQSAAYCKVTIMHTGTEAATNEADTTVISRNPDGSSITITCGIAWLGATLRVFNLEGKIIFEQKVVTTTTSVKWLQNSFGMYFYILTKTNGDISRGRF